MPKEIDLTVIVPFKNEAKRIEGTIKDILEYCQKSKFEIQVVFADSWSKDGSLDIVRKYAKKIEHLEYTEPKDDRKGKGQAVQDGILAAKGKYLMFMDADSSTRIWDLDNLLPFVDDYDIVMGSRYIKKARPYHSNYFWGLTHGLKSLFEVLIFGHSKDYMAKGKQGRLRQFISRGGNLAFTVLLNQSYVDQRCGFKLYHTKVAKFIAGLQRVYGFGFDTEYLAISQKYRFKTIEVPVDWYDDASSKVSPVNDTISSFRDIFRVQWNLLRGIYSKKHAKKKLGNLYEEVVLS